MEELNKNIGLVEDTTGPNAPNIATTDENLSVDVMYQQTAVPSLGRQIFSVVPMHGPTAALFNLKRKNGTNDIELLRNNVEVYPSTMLSTGLTLEVVQDILAQYGKEATKIIGNLLRGLVNEQENTRTQAFLTAQCKDYGGLTLSDSLNAEVNLFEIGQRVHELVLLMNSKNLRTYEAFAVVPYRALGGIMSLSAYAGADEVNERGLFITRIGQTNYYLNPFAGDLNVYVGLKDIKNPTKSSAIFSPYQSQVVDAQDADTGEMKYFIVNRFAITPSPLHELNNEMLYKFAVTV